MGYQHIILFQVKLNHQYFLNEVNTALTIEPTPETKEMLKDHRMLYKCKAGEGTVYFKGTLNADGTVDPFLEIADHLNDFDSDDPTVFRFYLYRNDPYYLNYTELGVDDLNRKILYLKALQFTSPTPITGDIPVKTVYAMAYDDPIEALSIRGNKFEYQLSPDTGDAPDPIFLDIHNHLDTLVASYEVEYDSVSEAYITQVDLSDQPRGKYVLKYNSIEDEIYIDEFLFGRKPFAVLEVYKESWWRNITINSGYRAFNLNFRVDFTARTASWYYYIILKSGNHVVTSTYEIVDEETTNPDDNRYLNGDFHSAPFVCEDVTPGGGTDIGGYPAKIFKCTTGLTGDEDITYLQESKPDLTLYKDSAQLLTNLPNPDIQSTNAEIIIYV